VNIAAYIFATTLGLIFGMGIGFFAGLMVPEDGASSRKQPHLSGRNDPSPYRKGRQ
jgi:hypothetical protein